MTGLLSGKSASVLAAFCNQAGPADTAYHDRQVFIHSVTAHEKLYPRSGVVEITPQYVCSKILPTARSLARGQICSNSNSVMSAVMAIRSYRLPPHRAQFESAVAVCLRRTVVETVAVNCCSKLIWQVSTVNHCRSIVESGKH